LSGFILDVYFAFTDIST